MIDAVALLPTATQRPDPPHPCCPQFRPLRGDGTYPIPGYCAPAAAPSALMVPSVEEFRTLCTTPAFRHCPWGETRQTAELPTAPPVAARNLWMCPTLRWSPNSG